jgi:hypothetical protein
MTNSSQNQPPSDRRRNLLARLVRIARHPATLTIGVSLVAIAGVGYVAIRSFVYQRLSPILEEQLSKFLQRPVEIGEVESLAWTLNRVRLGPSSVPATATDRDRLFAQSVEIAFNPFPLIFGQPLPLEIKVANSELFLDQDKSGTWINLAREEEQVEELPVDLDVTVRVQNGDLLVKPQATTAPIPLIFNGNIRYVDSTKERQLEYDINADLFKSAIDAQGETDLNTGRTEVELAVNKFAPAELLTLIPNFPLKINRGQFDADLKVNVPSRDEIEQTRGQGSLDLQQIEASIQPIKDPIRANIALNLQGQKVLIEKATASIGQVVNTSIAGEVDWQKGFNLNIKVNPVDLPNLLRTLSVTLPVKINGALQADLQVRGAVDNPVVTGTIGNTKPLQVDKTGIRQVNTSFQADLNKILLKSVQIRPAVGGQIIGVGRVETNIGQALENDRQIDFTKMPVTFSVRAQLPTEEVVAPYYRFPQGVTVGTLTAQGQLRGTFERPIATLKWQAPRAGVTANVDVSGTGEVLLVNDNIAIRNTVLRTDEGTAVISGNGNLNTKRWQTSVKANSFALSPFLSPLCAENPSNYCAYAVARNPILENGNIFLSGRLDDFDLDTIDGIAALTVRADRGLVALRGELSKGRVEASALASQFSLNLFLPNLSAPVDLRQSRVTLSGAIADLLEGSTVAARTFQADIDAVLDVAGSQVDASGRLDNGIVQAVATTGQLSLTKLFPNLPLPTQIQRSQANLSGNLPSLLASLDSTPDFSSFIATANARLAVASGTVTAAAQLDNNRWKTNILANNLNTSQILDRLQPNLRGQQQIANLDGLVSLAGPISPLFQRNASLPIQAQAIALRLQDRSLNLNADGTILVSNLFATPAIASNLNVSANSDLDRLPLTQFVAQIPVRRSLLPQELDVTGDGSFQGRFVARNLLNEPTAPGNLRLTGNLRLEDFSLNDRPFDPILSGPVTLAPGQEIALDLRGEDDIIAANLDPCTRPDCRAPYLVSSFQLRQTTDNLPSIIAEGRRVGDRLLAQVQNFPLSLLNISPAAEYGIIGTLEGQLSANLDVNLFTLTGRGDMAIAQPRVGNRQARSFNASFAYENNIAQLDTAVLELERGRYEAEGAINFASGAIRGRLNADEGYVQDLLATLQVYDIQSLVALLQLRQPDYASAAQVPTQPLGNANATVAEQVNVLWAIDQRIRQLVAQREAGGVPTQLDIRGAFDTEITLAGTLKNPQVNFQLQGDNWEWHTQPTFATIVRPLGLVIADTEVVPIDSIVLQGSLQNGVVAIDPARIQIRDSIVSFTGGLRTATLTLQPSQLIVENLSVDTVNNFVEFPADLAGNLKARAVLSGKLLNPTIQGQYSFTDAAFGGRAIDRTLAGNFNYANSRLDLRTTDDSVIQLYASVPYPTAPNTNDRVTVDVKLGDEGLSLLEVFTQGQLAWLGGNGDVTLQANGRLDLSEGFRLYDLSANGQIVLQDATIKSAALLQPLNVNGQIDLENQLLRVRQLEGTFAESRLAVTGVLPLFVPLSRQDPDADNPLTIAINQGEIDLQNLYRGGIDASVTVTGAAILPAIAGDVRLYDGRVFVPQQQTNDGQAIPIVRQPNSNPIRPGDTALFIPRLDNLQVALENLSVDESLYRFDFGGALTLNGPVNNLRNVQAQGAIALNRGRFSFLETRFLLDRRYNNVIVFNRQQGLFNPNLDIRMRTIVTELPESKFLQADRNNEIPDDNFSRVRRVDITLALEGQLSQLVPGLGRDVAEVCQIQSPSLPPIPQQRTISPEELERLQTCLQVIALANEDGTDAQLLGNPVVELSSRPSRSQGQIVRLLSQQFIVLADVLQNQNTEQILEYGVVQLALPFVLEGVVYDVENSISNVIGSADFRLFPLIQTSYRVDEDSFVGISYDYTFNEVRVEYQTRF